MINFTITELRYVVALAEEKHFARAAQKCFVSQPTLSIAIKKLEENLGINIFERKSHQIIITQAGAILLAQAKKIINEANQLISIASLYQDQYKFPLRVGAILTIGPYIFPALVNKILQELPKLQLTLEENFTDSLIESLLNGNLDLIIVATQINHNDLVQESFAEDELDMIFSSSHNFAKLNKISPKVLDDETLLLLGNGNCLRDQILQLCSNQASRPGNQITTSSLETIKYMVGMNLGVSILPRLAQKHLPQNISIKSFSGKPPKRVLNIVYRKSSPRMNVIMQIKAMLESLV